MVLLLSKGRVEMPKLLLQGKKAIEDVVKDEGRGLLFVCRCVF